MRLRPASAADSAALLSLWNAAAPLTPLNEALLQENVFGDDGADTDTRYVIEAADSLIGFAMGVTRSGDGETRGSVKMLAVAPEARGQGHGARLLEAVERILSERGARRLEVCGAAPNYLCPGVDERYVEGLAFLERRGYRPVGSALDMRVALAGREFPTDAETARLHARGVTVRRAGADDQAALDGLLDEFGGSWAREVAISMAAAEPRVHLAFDGEALLGFSAWGGNNAADGGFGPMGTRPAARGLGIGGVLLKRCLADLRDAGFESAVIPWVGPVAFYEQQVGARVTARYVRLEKVLE